jgi:hypothetical protein
MGKATTDSNAFWDRTRAFREVLDQIRTAGPTDSTVLIEGDTGTGEEVAATAIHALSDCRNRPLRHAERRHSSFWMKSETSRSRAGEAAASVTGTRVQAVGHCV